MAAIEGLEPTTPCLTGRTSTLLMLYRQNLKSFPVVVLPTYGHYSLHYVPLKGQESSNLPLRQVNDGPLDRG